jgi:hypothetical protein
MLRLMVVAEQENISGLNVFDRYAPCAVSAMDSASCTLNMASVMEITTNKNGQP